MQLVIRSNDNPSINQMLKMNDLMLWYNRVTSDVFIDTLFYDNRSTSKHQFICAQVLVADFGYTHISPMKSKGDLQHAMKNSFMNVGVPPDIIVDFAGEQVQGEDRVICEQVGCHI